MKAKVSKTELRECVRNAFMRVLEEGYDEKETMSRRDREKNFKKKTPKHGKMGPMKKPKYKDDWN